MKTVKPTSDQLRRTFRAVTGFEALLLALLLPFLLVLPFPANLAVGVLFGAIAAFMVAGILDYRASRQAPSAGPVRAGEDAIVGQRAEVLEPLAPFGTVRLRGELWKAKSTGPASIPSGTVVIVQSVDGLTLLVSKPAPEDTR